jgi:hypothetical protein
VRDQISQSCKKKTKKKTDKIVGGFIVQSNYLAGCSARAVCAQFDISSSFIRFMINYPMLYSKDVFQIIWNRHITFIIVISICRFIRFLLRFVPFGSSTFLVFSRKNLENKNYCLKIRFFIVAGIDESGVWDTRRNKEIWPDANTWCVSLKETEFLEGPAPVFCRQTPMFLSPENWRTKKWIEW